MHTALRHTFSFGSLLYASPLCMHILHHFLKINFISKTTIQVRKDTVQGPGRVREFTQGKHIKVLLVTSKAYYSRLHLELRI